MLSLAHSIVSVPGHCLFIYFIVDHNRPFQYNTKHIVMIYPVQFDSNPNSSTEHVFI